MAETNYPAKPGAKNLLPEQLASLAQANKLVARQQYAAGARIFAMLAVELENSQRILQAANLHAMAALTFAEAYTKDKSLTPAEITEQTASQARMALLLFIHARLYDHTRRFYNTIIRKIQKLGMSPAVLSLKTEFGRYGTSPLSLMTLNAIQRAGLPPACATCASPLRGDEVTWLDARTIECAYCGEQIHLKG